MSKKNRKKLKTNHAVQVKSLTQDEKYRLLAEFGNDIIFMRDKAGQMLYVSPALKTHLGRNPKDHIGKYAQDLVFKEDRERVWEDWKKTIFREKKVFKSRVRLVHKNGSLVWMESISEPVLDDSGKVVAAVTTSRNIDDQIKIEEEKNRLARIVRESPDEIYIIDPETLRILDANVTACKRTGFSIDSLKRKTICRVKMDCTVKRAKQKLKPVLEGRKEHLRAESRHRTKNGQIYTVATDVYFSRSENEEVLVYVSRDISDLKEAEKQKRSAEKLYKLLAEHIHDVIVLREPNGKIIYITPSIEKFLGFKVKTAINRASWAFVHPDDRNHLKEQWKENILEKGQGFESLVRTRDNKGKYHWFEAYHKPIKDKNGKVTAVVSSTREVTKRVEAEEKFRLLAENTTDIILLRDQTGRTKYITPSVDKFTGFPVSRGLKAGKTPYDFIHPQDAKRIKKIWEEKFLKNGEGYENEVRIKHKSGDYQWYFASTAPIRNKAGKIIGAVTSCKNIHEQKIAAQAKERAEKRFRTLVDHTSDVIWHRDSKGNVIYVSPSVKRHLGFGPGTYLGKPTWEHLHPDDKRLIKDWKREVIQKGKSRRAKTRMKHRDGHFIWFDAVTEPVKDKDGKVIYSVTTARNITKQVAAEKEKSKLTAIVEQALNEIFILDPETGKFIYANPAALKNTGYSLKELKNMSPWDISVYRSKKEIKKLIGNIDKNTPKKVFFEGQNKRKDGSVYDVEVIIQKIHEEKASHILVLIVDITEKKKTEARIEEANQRFRMFAEYGSDILVQRDSGGKVLYASPSLEKHLGWKPEELVGKTTWFMLDTKAREKIPEWKKQIFKEGKSARYQYLNRTKDGRKIWIESATEPIKDKKGVVQYAISTWRNITEEKKAEEQAKRLASIVEVSMNEIYVIDPATLKFLYVNESARKNLGYSKKELKKIGPSDIGARYTPEEALKFYGTLKKEKKPIQFEGRHKRKDGSVYDVALNLQHIETEGKEVFVAFGEDITEKKRSEELLRQARKLEVVGQLTGGIAHDFNNLLTTILNSLRMMEKNGVSREMQEILNLAIHSTKRGANLTHRLLAFARKQHLDPVVIRAGEVLENVHTILKGTLGGKIIIQIQKPERNLLVRVDSAEFENALLNLGINARDAMEKGGTLTLSAKNQLVNARLGEELELEPGEYVVTEVADTGTGMEEALIEKVVEPFFTTKEVGQGSGLGLSMVFGFAKQSKGSLEIKSKPGQGTTVRIYLPRVVGEKPVPLPRARKPD